MCFVVGYRVRHEEMQHDMRFKIGVSLAQQDAAALKCVVLHSPHCAVDSQV